MIFLRTWILRTVPDSCFRVNFISGSRNYMIIFFPIFHFHQAFLWFWGETFLKFSENYNKETSWGLYVVTPEAAGAEIFLGGFSGISKTSNQ